MEVYPEPTGDHQDLLQFLYAVPTGLVHARLDGHIELINSAAARWLLTLSPTSALDNLYTALGTAAPDLEKRVRRAAAAADVGVCATQRIVVDDQPRRGGPHVLAMTVSSLPAQRLMASFDDITQQVHDEQALLDAKAHYEAVVAALSEGVVVHGPQREVLTSNAAAERILGRPVAECAGLLPIPPGWQAFWLDGKPLSEADSPAARVLAGQGPQELVSLRAVGPSGEVRWLDLRVQPVLRPGDGALLAAVSSFSDTTQRERLTAELVRHREQLQSLVDQRTLELQASNVDLSAKQALLRTVADAVPGLISSWGTDLRARFANSAYLDWFGRSRVEMEGLPLQDLLGAEAFEQNRPHVEAALRGHAQHFQRTMRKADGRIAHALISYIPEWLDGQVRGFNAVLTDVTPLKQAEVRLTELNHKLAQRAQLADDAVSAKSAFLANMSHEIRTPMNAIIGLTHLMRRDAQDALLRDRLGKLDHAARHLLQVINDILDLSKIGAGKMLLHETEFVVDELLTQCLDMVTPQIQGRSLELVLEANRLPQRLRGDAGRLSQALINLLSNAVKFTQEGWVRLRAEVVEEGDRGLLVRFEVQDTGSGVEPERQAVLFNAFEQADNSATRQHGGTGLGLALTRHIAEIMGGDSGVDSWPGVGSTFWFSAWLHRSATPAPPPPAGAFAGLRSLVVDDLAVSLRVVDEGLKLLGLEVDALTDGGSALSWLERESKAGRKYDVVLVDKGMQSLDGVETLRRMQRLLGAAMPPSVLLLQRDEAAAAGPALASTTLFKPFATQALHDALQRAMGLRPNAMAREPASDQSGLEALRRHAGQRVLLVEDNRVNQEVAVELLASAGLVVETADNGLQAVDRVLAHSYDLVLMDVQMPHMDGMAATRAIRQRLGTGLPIVAMTANAFTEERAACLDAGMNDHVVKPVDPKRLYEALARWLPAPGTQPLAGGAVPPVEPQPAPPLGGRLAGLPGIDLAWALRSTGGRVDILERVMAKFVDRYRDGKPGLQARGVQDPVATLRAACHSLRGACGAIGASELKVRIESLERQLDESAPAEELLRTAEQLDDNLRALVLRLRTALAV